MFSGKHVKYENFHSLSWLSFIYINSLLTNWVNRKFEICERIPFFNLLWEALHHSGYDVISKQEKKKFDKQIHFLRKNTEGLTHLTGHERTFHQINSLLSKTHEKSQYVIYKHLKKCNALTFWLLLQCIISFYIMYRAVYFK